MARLIFSVGLLGVVLVHAPGASADEVTDVAAEHDYDEAKLRGALITLGLPQTAAAAKGYVAWELQPRDWIDGCLDRLAWAESRNDPNAVNRRSGASGLLQFLPSTWRTTPFASYSIFDASAQRQAGRWMLNQGRLHEWSTWRVCA